MSCLRLKKFKGLAVLVSCLMPTVAAAQDVRATLAATYGLHLVDGDGREAWSDEEEQVVLMLLASLPPGLNDVAKRATTGSIRVFKAYTSRPRTAHRVLTGLDWQLVLDLEDDPQQANRTRTLQRRLVHHLLHVFNLQHGDSRSAAWRRLSGWQYRHYFGVRLDFLPKESLNQDPRGFASAEGMRDATEDFVTTGAYYFVGDHDPTLACRLAEKFRYFQRLFPSTRRVGESACNDGAQDFLSDLTFQDPLTGRSLDMGPVGIDTVRGFELLYATPGVGDAAEVAGHLVLRIKLANNPMADQLGIENPNDLVVSFLADTDGDKTGGARRSDSSYQCQPSFWQLGGQPDRNYDAVASVTQALRGLAGGFLTTFDRQTLFQTVKNYTIDQDRNLLRFELNLSQDQQRRLLERLYAVKRSYKTKYYFFDRNCASVLVQIIGEGIGNHAVADFSPVVSPPNSLIAMLLRQQLVTQVFPSFYSYRRRGHVAQAALTDLVPRTFHHRLLSNDPDTRLGAFKQLLSTDGDDVKRWQLASLGQDAELAHAVKGGRCEDMTSPVTAYLREVQRAALRQRPMLATTALLDVNQLVERRYAAVEARHAATGSEHTSLSSLFVGAAVYQDGGDEPRPGAAVEFALFRQAMGANSRVTMQRATSVQLGEFKAVAGQDSDGNEHLSSWRATGLSLRKFKERLDSVPAYIEPPGSFGLGLTVLDVVGTRRGIDTTLVRGELLANVWAAPNYDSYFFLSAGGAVHLVHERDLEREGEVHHEAPVFHGSLPLRVEGLWSIDGSRASQLRGAVEYQLCVGKCGSKWHLSGGYAHVWLDSDQHQALWRISLEHEEEHQSEGPYAGAGRRDLLTVGVEWNRW